MQKIISLGCKAQSLLNATRAVDFLGPLALRIYLAPIFILAGWGKLKDLESTAYYFGEYLGLPFPDLMAFLSGTTEFFGGIALMSYFAGAENEALMFLGGIAALVLSLLLLKVLSPMFNRDQYKIQIKPL